MDDEATFRRLFEANYEDLLRFVERRAHPIAAEEARAWLFGVAQRTLLNQRRGDARRGSLHIRVRQSPSQTTEDHSADVAARLDLARAWSRLSPRDQETLTLTGLDGLSGPQAAHVLNITPTAFSLRLLRARRRLRAHLTRAVSHPGPQRGAHPAARTLPDQTPRPASKECP